MELMLEHGVVRRLVLEKSYEKETEVEVQGMCSFLGQHRNYQREEGGGVRWIKGFWQWGVLHMERVRIRNTCLLP